MSEPEAPGAPRFTRLSTSMKMLLLMSGALAPLGLIASFASLQAAQANRINRQVAARLLAGDSADRLNLYLDRADVALRAAPSHGADACRRAATALAPAQGQLAGIRVAAFDDADHRLCGPRDLPPPPASAGAADPEVRLDEAQQTVRILVGDEAPGSAVAEVPAAAIARAAHPHALDGSFSLSLVGPGGTIWLTRAPLRPMLRRIPIDLPIAGGRLHLRMQVVAAPLSANELLLILLPLLMWIAGAAIGWLVVDRLLVRPLGDMQAAIEQYRMEGGRLALPHLTTPAAEIRALGDAFSRTSATIVRHEAELEEGLARQTRLTREVHHRVKNNLQVVASLLNIHARGAATPSAADAYATIQRRVDALALVHRSHYAELEVNRGLALKPLIGELVANLRGSTPAGLAPPVFSLSLDQLHCTQDVAVSVAFLVTEVVEAAMLRAGAAAIAISLAALPEGARARLAIRSPALIGPAAAPGETAERFDRVVGGLARQLRATLERDWDSGLIAVEIAVFPEGADAA